MSNTDPSATLPWFAENGVNLASPKLGATVLYATDEFFAPKERLAFVKTFQVWSEGPSIPWRSPRRDLKSTGYSDPDPLRNL